MRSISKVLGRTCSFRFLIRPTLFPLPHLGLVGFFRANVLPQSGTGVTAIFDIDHVGKHADVIVRHCRPSFQFRRLEHGPDQVFAATNISGVQINFRVYPPTRVIAPNQVRSLVTASKKRRIHHRQRRPKQGPLPIARFDGHCHRHTVSALPSKSRPDDEPAVSIPGMAFQNVAQRLGHGAGRCAFVRWLNLGAAHSRSRDTAPLH